MFDVLTLSRIQFALTIGFHYIFPPLSIGLSIMLIIFEGMYLKTKKEKYRTLTKFWTNIFALTFALGVATGLVQVFAFGNNWGRYSEFVGDVFGSMLAAEGIFAFFLEAGFIGIMLFGWTKVSKGVHYLATILVSLGAHFSATWIVAANSWMQTPQGFAIVGHGDKVRAVMTSYWSAIFNPSFVDRIVHVLLGAWLTGAFLVISVSAYYLWQKKRTDFAKTSMKVGLIVGSICLVLQLWSADSSARGVAKNQPIKLAAMEGLYKTQTYSPMTLIGYADHDNRETHGIKVPGLLSALTHRSFEKPVAGLDQFPEENWPYVPAVFQVYHLMIVMWGLMVLAALLGWYYYKRDSFETSKVGIWFLISSVTFPFIANEAGWFTAEMGRQPWVVYNLLKTAQGVSHSLDASQVVASIVMFVIMFTLLFALFIFLLDRKIKAGPISVKNEDRKADVIYRNIYQRNEEHL